MTKKELKELKTAIKKIVIKAKKDPKLRNEILHGMGMYSKSGKLLSEFK